MSIPELSIQLKNIPGQITLVTSILAESDINIIGIAASTTGKTGWLRLIVDNTKLAEEALADCGFNVDSGVAVAMDLSNEPGTLDTALRVLADEKINVDYVYTCAIPNPPGQTIIIGVQSPGKAETVLKSNGLRIADIHL